MTNSPFRVFCRRVLPVLLFTAIGFLVMGYHPGAEDDGVYLAAVKAQLHPSLFPHDAAFFQLQMRTSVFDTWMAQFVHTSGIGVAWAEFLWQWISIVLMVWACWSILCHLFEDAVSRWAGLAMVAAMFTLPVAGTAIYIMDQHLHPRNLATALLLLGVSRIVAGKGWQAVPLALVAFLLHPLMGALGAAFCLALGLAQIESLQVHLRSLRERLVPQNATPVVALIPFSWIFDSPSPAWLEAAQSRRMLHLYQWTWYEWLGAIGPLVLFWLLLRHARHEGNERLARFATALLAYGLCFQLFSMVILSPFAPTAFCTLEPMRYLQMTYIFLAMFAGAYLGRYVLKARAWRWAAFLLIFNGGMFFVQRQLFAGTPHIELPSANAGNAWLQAFDWVRRNTPENAYFALDPNYIAIPGEDTHSFRALAERSVLADANKDTSVVTKEPELGPAWFEQQSALAGWSGFQPGDFQRLKANFGVNWVVVSYPQPGGLICLWHNSVVSVCQIP